jgi:GNAT superfamily N-acetyltransferase
VTGDATINAQRRPKPLRAATLSGAHIRRIRPSTAATFLTRNGLDPDEPLRWALGAFEPPSDLIGVVAVAGGAIPLRVAVAVAPERRRLKVGTDLVTALIHQDTSLSIGPLSAASCPSPTTRSFLEYLAAELIPPAATTAAAANVLSPVIF